MSRGHMTQVECENVLSLVMIREWLYSQNHEGVFSLETIHGMYIKIEVLLPDQAVWKVIVEHGSVWYTTTVPLDNSSVEMIIERILNGVGGL